MFLSKITVDACSKLVLRDLSSHYEMHRTIMRAFPSGDDGGPGRVLFRIEQSTDAGSGTVLVQSDKKPDWSSIRQIPGYVIDVRTKEFRPCLRQGQLLRFRLRANPTVKRRVEDKAKRLGLDKEEDQMQWLVRKGQSGGFTPRQLAVTRAIRLSSSTAKGTQTHVAVDFEGVLEVVDPIAFEQTLTSGIGPAKGYGFGLLSIASV